MDLKNNEGANNMADNLNISPEMIQNLVNMLNNSNNQTSNNKNGSTNISSNNTSNDQDSKLLYSLKPYLRKSRQAKLDQYINILKISQVSKLFKKGDVN